MFLTLIRRSYRCGTVCNMIRIGSKDTEDRETKLQVFPEGLSEHNFYTVPRFVTAKGVKIIWKEHTRLSLKD